MPSKKLRARQAKASKDSAQAPAPAPAQATTLAQMDRAQTRSVRRHVRRCSGGGSTFVQEIPSSRGQHIPSHARAELRRELGPAAVAHKAATKGSTPNAAPAPAPDTYIDERRSYCESCDTYKTGVQWWSAPFETSKPPLITIGGRNDKRKVMSACKSCLKHVPEHVIGVQCPMD
jgi:hypothetical protein